MEPIESTSAETCALDPGVEREWEGLAERLDAAPFLRPGWFAAFGRAFEPGPLRLACTRRGGRLVGILPLTERRGALAGPVNWHTPAYGGISEDAEATAALARHLLGSRARRLDLSFLLPGDPLAGALRAEAAARRLPVLERVVRRSPYIDLAGSWEEFEAALSAKRRANIRRRWRRLGERGEVTVELVDGSERLEALLAEAYAIEAAGWKGSGGTAIASQPQTERFYAELARWAAGRGWLRVWFLRLDGRALAFAYCLAQGGVLYGLKIGFEPEARPFAPGTLLTREMLVTAFGEGLSRYELLGQPDPYKLDWTDAVDDLTRVQVFARTPSGLFSLAKWRFGPPLVQRAQAALRSDHPLRRRLRRTR
jgi:CelD/BcsL family acetyltransferase involved in cellulose biosynthesis